VTKQQVISVGVWVPGNADEYVDFKSDRSLLDADIIVFSPNLRSYAEGEHYQGKATISSTDSAKLFEDAQHWKREITIALEAGKTVFLFMTGLETVYIFTGEKQYSGTGRNARQTNIVSHFDPYSAVPLTNLVVSWAVLKWSVRSDRQADVSMFGCRSIPPLDSPPAVPTGV
jgi:hypothetical protein